MLHTLSFTALQWLKKNQQLCTQISRLRFDLVCQVLLQHSLGWEMVHHIILTSFEFTLRIPAHRKHKKNNNNILCSITFKQAGWI